MISLILAMAAAQAEPVDPDSRRFEGDWIVTDVTDNNTGEREVDASVMYYERGRSDLVHLRMKCVEGSPTMFLDWFDLELPDQAVVTFHAIDGAETEPAQFVMQKSTDAIDRGLRASPEVSSQIVSLFGDASFTYVTLHLQYRNRSFRVGIEGAQDAWARVVRHCPVRTYPLPPI